VGETVVVAFKQFADDARHSLQTPLGHVDASDTIVRPFLEERSDPAISALRETFPHQSQEFLLA
jgi:hypothetical protein